VAKKPKALGLTLCDQVIFEEKTHKPSLIGMFTGIAADRFPSVPRRFDVFAALTDGFGVSVLDLVAIRLETDEEIYAQAMTLNFNDPLQVVNLRFRVTQLPFPAPGVYLFTLSIEAEEIAQRRLSVYLAEEPS
jgi:hypothetical protein